MRIFAALFLILLAGTASAAVVELNTQSLNQCRNQIAAANTRNIVIVAYEEGCPWWSRLKPSYENLSESLNYPASYFKFEFTQAAPGVTTGCLQYNPRYCPTILIYSKSKKRYALVRSKEGYQSKSQLTALIQGSK